MHVMSAKQSTKARFDLQPQAKRRDNLVCFLSPPPLQPGDRTPDATLLRPPALPSMPRPSWVASAVVTSPTPTSSEPSIPTPIPSVIIVPSVIVILRRAVSVVPLAPPAMHLAGSVLSCAVLGVLVHIHVYVADFVFNKSQRLFLSCWLCCTAPECGVGLEVNVKRAAISLSNKSASVEDCTNHSNSPSYC